ncbi:PH domain-containing protein [Sporosarcina cyprini]|uniref:PH domain-containing protein n=1 Tax=Sporosarcina cyprini TaxID=2910523 RepID=UPI001EDEE3AC|nr:PH domain-containing protein [Sporosarcina cyprini]MCG3088407.1 PH domain-containing protein [Sporosarcina cyprini]
MNMKRYHPLTLVYDLFTFVKNMAIVAIVLFVVNYGSKSFLFVWGRRLFAVIVVLTVVSLGFKWLTNRYAVDHQAFHLKSGLFTKTERTVYFDKVQNVQRRTSFIHKLFRMTSMTFETAADASDSNVEFKMVTKQEADRLESLVKVQHEEMTTESELPEVEMRTIHFSSTHRDIIKATFTSFNFLVLIALAASIFSKLDTIFDLEDKVEGWVLSVLTSGWLIAGIAIILMAVSMLAGFVWTYIKYGKYEIASDEKRIMIRKGMIDETEFTILKTRVQAIEITQSLIKRVLGLAEVKLISAGGLGEEEQEISTLYPFLPMERAYSMIEEMLPGYKVLRETKRLPSKSLLVRLAKPYWFWLIVTAVLVYFRPEPFGWHAAWWISSLLLLAAAVLIRIVNYVNTTYAMTNGFIQISEGVLEKAIYLSRRDKIVEVKVNRSKLQQWTGLATIGIVNRAKPVRHEMLEDVSLQEAGRFYSWYAGRVEEIKTK